MFLLHDVVAQKSPLPVATYGCGDAIMGLFRQATHANWSPSRSTPAFDLLIEKKPPDGFYPLTEVEKIESAYMFSVSRGKESNTTKPCPTVVAVFGELISPIGKRYAFDRATFDTELRTLKFVTVEKDGIAFEGKAALFPAPMRERDDDGGFVMGNLQLKAFGKEIGEVTLEFDFGAYQRILP